MMLLLAFLLTGCAVAVPAVLIGGGAVVAYAASGRSGPTGVVKNIHLKLKIQRAWKENNLPVLPLLISGNKVMICGYYAGDIRKHIDAIKIQNINIFDHTQKMQNEQSYSQDVFLKTGIVSSLLTHRYTQSRNYEITVIDGVVYILADVYNNHEKEELIKTVENTKNVRHFEYNIDVKPGPVTWLNK